MLDAVDETVRNILLDQLGEQFEGVTISFAIPDGQFPPASVPLPAINLFLFDVHENRTLREPETRVRQTGGRFQRVYPPVRVDCHYLVTAWTGESDVAGEHRLLGQVLKALIRYRYVPEPLVDDDLEEQPMSVRAFALQSEGLGASSEFWRALGCRPRASLRFTITIAVEAIPADDVAAPPTRVVARVGDRRGGASDQSTSQA